MTLQYQQLAKLLEVAWSFFGVEEFQTEKNYFI